MLKVENLTKIYKNGESTVLALHNVSFTLNNKGFVFIIGKSGCGKSTLLNIIGGLDNLTSGDVVCDGNRLSEFTNSDFDNYRNTYLGFIFQDFCLIDDLNVYQNIELALDIKGENLTKKEKTKKIEQALSDVDLHYSMKRRYVKELSGGQKQRIAIARALIKDPKLILADEPTGNLDSKTSEKILQTLKKLSEDRLVVIISHNLDSAKKYADRIIELEDGEILSDTSREIEDVETLTLNKGVLTLPHSTTLSSGQLKEINKNLKDNKIKEIKQHSKGFTKTKENFVDNGKVDIEPKKMSKSSSFKLSKHFIKKRFLATFATIIVVTALIFVLGMSQFLIQFDEKQTVYSTMQKNGETDLLIYNGFYDENNWINSKKCVEITDEDTCEVIDAGYTDNVYKLYNNTLGITTYNFQRERIITTQSLFKNGFVTESFGTLACDEELLLKHFGVNGKLEVLAGVINDSTQNSDVVYEKHGVIITDYFADSIVKLRTSTYPNYSKIVGKYYRGTYINGIIKTDYKEKYSDVIKYASDVAIGINRAEEKQYYTERMATFMADVQKKYGLAYSTEPQFETLSKYSEKVSDVTLNNAVIEYEDGRTQKFTNTIYMYKVNNLPLDLAENEIATRYDIFNSMFGGILGVTYTEETLDTFEPVTLRINKTDGTAEGKILYSLDLTIKTIFGKKVYSGGSSTSNYIWTNNTELYEMIHQNSIYSFGMYLEDASQLDKIYNVIENNPYTVQSQVYKSISQVGYIVEIFDDLFWVIVGAIGTTSVILLISYSYGNIKKRYYEIGVLKALGATTKNVAFIFTMQMIFAGILISVLSTLMLMTLCSPINNLIAIPIISFINNSNITELTIISANTPTLIINIGIVLFVTLLSCLIPIIKLNKIKPKNIISKDK